MLPLYRTFTVEADPIILYDEGNLTSIMWVTGNSDSHNYIICL